MKVLLIAPYVNLIYDKSTKLENREDFYPSAALLHLAAMLRANNYEPTIVDLNNTAVHNHKEKYLDYCKKTIIDSLNECKPDLVGINCLFSGTFPDVLEFAKTVKSHSPHLKVAIGGIHPTSFPKEILSNCNDIDYIAIGEGENTIVALAASIKAKNENLLSYIKSFAYRDKDGIVRINREKNYIDNLDSLPIPAWDLININKFEMKLNHYYNPPKLPIKYKAAIFSSRACPLSCNFCDMFLVMGKKHRKKSVNKIADEIELLNKSYGVNFFSFMDDNLTLNKTHIIDLCNEIIKRGIKIIFNTPNGVWINSIRENVVAKMVEAGFVHAAMPIEHGNDYIRNKVIGKVLDRKKIFEVAKLFKKYKVMTHGIFIMGFPEDTNETLKSTYDMMHELQLDNTGIHPVIPFPGTALFKQVVKDKLLLGDWNLDELWKTPVSVAGADFYIKPYNMSLDDLYKWREKFDSIKIQYWKTNADQTPETSCLKSGKNIGTDSSRVASRLIHRKKNALIFESVDLKTKSVS